MGVLNAERLPEIRLRRMQLWQSGSCFPCSPGLQKRALSARVRHREVQPKNIHLYRSDAVSHGKIPASKEAGYRNARGFAGLAAAVVNCQP